MNPKCPGCQECGPQVIRAGRYYRADDSRYIQRFRCKACGKSFSSATHSACYRQKKRRINRLITPYLCSAMSQRRLALVLQVNRATVARRLVCLAEQARRTHRGCLAHKLREHGLFQQIQFDDLHSFEHTKCKPLAVCVVIDPIRRYILDISVAAIPASGPLAATARRKYGPRPDCSRARRDNLFQGLRGVIAENAHFISDQHTDYPGVIKRHFPTATHRAYKGRKGCVTGQGEMKKGGFDPLFSINHTLAMLRDNIGRLVRRTWCTTKDPERLADLLAMYRVYHNRELIPHW